LQMTWQAAGGEKKIRRLSLMTENA